MRRFTIILVTLMSILLMNISAQAADIKWQSYGPTAFNKAKKEKKLVLIFGKAEWCPWCSATKTKVFTNPMVIQVVNQYYVPVMLDVDKEAILANQYEIRQLPTFVILNGNYRVIRTFAGYREPQDVAAMLEGVALRGVV